MKISIIVPVYNVEKYIARCVDSLRNQTLTDIDIVLIDDGSTDGSPAMIDSYAAMDSRIQVMHKKNAGQGYARNDGLRLAKGEYVLFLDSDDYLEQRTCEELYELMVRTGADMCTYGHQIDAPTGECVRKPRILDDTYDGEDVRKRFTLHFYGDDPSDDNLRGYSSCMSCFRVSLIREHNLEFPSEREVLSEDNLFCLSVCRYAQRVVTTSKIYYHYCLKADSFSQGYSEVRMPMTKVLAAHLLEYASEFGVCDEANIRIAGMLWINMMATIKQDVRRQVALNQVSKSQVLDDIRELCADDDFQKILTRLRGTALPKQQRVFLWAYLNKHIHILYFMAAVRGRRRL